MRTTRRASKRRVTPVQTAPEVTAALFALRQRMANVEGILGTGAHRFCDCGHPVFKHNYARMHCLVQGCRCQRANIADASTATPDWLEAFVEWTDSFELAPDLTPGAPPRNPYTKTKAAFEEIVRVVTELRQKSVAMQTSLAALTSERDTLKRKLSLVTDEIFETLKSRVTPPKKRRAVARKRK